MATAYIPESPRPVWSTRWVEWGLLALCIAVVMGVLWRYGQQVRAQSERAAVQSTLGALRTALVLDYVHRMIPASSKAKAVAPTSASLPNPFDLLQQPAANYAGEVPAALLQEVAPGRWVFDKRCGCVGYKPQDISALDTPAGSQAVWFTVETTGAAPQLRPIQSYMWAGLPLE
jgi:hypothetical protein